MIRGDRRTRYVRADGMEWRMSDCLHCDINELVRKHIETHETADMSTIASMLVESLADFILSAPEAEQAGMMAEALAHFGHAFLDKGEDVEPGPHGAH
jgi:hypothetical protein